jgi:hypothetical protein
MTILPKEPPIFTGDSYQDSLNNAGEKFFYNNYSFINRCKAIIVLGGESVIKVDFEGIDGHSPKVSTSKIGPGYNQIFNNSSQ